MTSSARWSAAIMVSGHGFGHSVRSAEVAKALLKQGARVVVRTDAPRWLFPEAVEWIECETPLDIGVAQHDGLEMDIDETRRQWTHFLQVFEARVDGEARLLRSTGIDVVLGDIPPLAFAAASRAGLPSVALTNFGWDWIYSAWPGFEEIVGAVRAGYAQADVLFRLPLHSRSQEAFPAFKRIVDVPLIARRATRTRQDVRAQLRLPQDARVVLLSFGGFTARGLDLDALASWDAFLFLTTPPMAPTASAPNVRMLNQTPVDYVSLLAACDAVVTKPGYGIVADCLANRVPALFTDRGPFREYDVLAEALPRLGRALHIPREALVSGRLGPYLEALFASDGPWTLEAMNGADVVAEKLLTLGSPRSAR